MSSERGDQTKDQFRLSSDELKVPSVDRYLWLQSLIGFQLEGLEYGVTPQNMRGRIPESMLQRWHRLVWRTYMKDRSRHDRRAAMVYARGRIKSTRQTVGATGSYSLRSKRS